jgi:WD40 repeat protein
MRNRRTLLALLIFTACAAITRADVIPRLRTTWKEKEARVEAFSPDGRSLVSSGGDSFQLRDAASGEVRAVLTTLPYRLNGPKFSPDGRFLFASVSTDRHKPVWVYDLKVWEVATGKEYASFPYLSDSLNVSTDFFALSGDGRTLAFLDNSERLPIRVKTGKMSFNRLPEITTYHNDNPGLGRVKIWDVLNWEEVATLDGGSHMVFSPDGRTLITGARDWKDPMAKVWEAGSWKLRAEFDSGGPWVKPIAFSPDSKYLAIGAAKNQVLYEFEGGQKWPVPALDRRNDGPTFSHDGRLLFPGGMPRVDTHISGGGPNTCYDLAAMPPTRSDLGSGEAIISPDGRCYAALIGERFKRGSLAVALHDLPSMRETGRIETDGLVGAGFSPDGRWLALMVGRHEVMPPGSPSRYVLEIRLLDSTTARVLATIPSPGETWGNYGWKFTPDGKSLAIRYRTGSNVSKRGDPSPSDRPMTLELWDIMEK